jgi:hypothetical protein
VTVINDKGHFYCNLNSERRVSSATDASNSSILQQHLSTVNGEFTYQNKEPNITPATHSTSIAKPRFHASFCTTFVDENTTQPFERMYQSQKKSIDFYVNWYKASTLNDIG